jgi:cellulose biosynthesis protein BcsQ
VPPTTHALLTCHYPIEQVILKLPRYQNLSIIPSNADLADAALRLAHRPHHLRQLLAGLPKDVYDVVFIDTGKGLDPLAVNALAAASVPEPPKKNKDLTGFTWYFPGKDTGVKYDS